MKRIRRKILAAGLGVALLATTVFALSEGDTILTRDYVDDVLEPLLASVMNEQILSVMQGGYDDSEAVLDGVQDEAKSTLELQISQSNVAISPMDYGQGDVVRLNEGGTLLVTDGLVQLTHDGVVIDATTGLTCASGSYTETSHRYIVGEDTQCTATVISGLAKMGYEGVYGYSAGTGKNHPFYDVYSTDSYNDSVTFVYSTGLFQGVETNRFAPDSSMTRAMVATVLYRLAGEPADQMAAATNSFTDVADTAWYADYVSWCASVGVSNGVGDGAFAPDNGVTILQMIQFLYNFGSSNLGLTLEGTADLSTVTGGTDVADWGVQAAQWAVANGVWTGTLENRLATRAEVATMLMNFSIIYS